MHQMLNLAPQNVIREIKFKAGGFLTRCLLAGPEDGEVVLLLHDAAFGGSSDVSWEYLLPLLSQRYRVIAPDLLGFGGSDKAIFVDRSPYDFRIAHVLAVLDGLGVEGKVHAVGNSFGGSMTMHMLRHHAHRLASIVNISGTGGGWRTDFGKQILGNWDGTRDGLKRIVDVLVDPTPSFDFEAHVDQRYDWAKKEGHFRAVIAPGTALPEALISGAKRDPFPKVPDNGVPVLLVAGKRDVLIDADWTDKLAPLLSTRCDVEVLDAKHAANLDQCTSLWSVLDPWLRAHSQR